MTTERVPASRDDAYLCRWRCPAQLLTSDGRNWHERNTHGATYTGALAAEVDRLKAEATALRTALAGLVVEARDIIRNARRTVRCLCVARECECWTSLTAALEDAEAALNAGGKP